MNTKKKKVTVYMLSLEDAKKALENLAKPFGFEVHHTHSIDRNVSIDQEFANALDELASPLSMKLVKNDYVQSLSSHAALDFISTFKKNYINIPLIRIGGDKDGAYLIPDILDNISFCYSAGVGGTSDFENELSKVYGIKSFLADASVDGPAIDNSDFSFVKKFLGSKNSADYTTLWQWMLDTLPHTPGEKKLILQMDIEDGEYDVLTFEDSNVLQKFTIMIIEFHSFQNLFDVNFNRMVSSIFDKIYKDFAICHVHPNNCCGGVNFENVKVPKVLEVTFINKKELENIELIPKPISLPHKLDVANVSDRPELIMPDIWWN